MTTTSDGKKTFRQLSRRLGACFLAAVLLGIMLPAEALACDIKEIELYVANTEAAAQTTTATSTSTCQDTVWFRLRWLEDDSGNCPDNDFWAGIYKDPYTDIGNGGPSDRKWYDADITDIDPGWQQVVDSISTDNYTLKAVMWRQACTGAGAVYSDNTATVTDNACGSGESCCDSLTCYNASTEICCGDGYGTVCNNTDCCCDTPGGGADFCCALIDGWLPGCCEDECCTSGQWCCDNGCCDTACCGDEGCCGASKYCCGSETCCVSGAEVCCYNFFGDYHYCTGPCSDQVTDTNTCSEDNEPALLCNECKQLTPPTCSTYQDYTGLQIETCYDGCDSCSVPSDWDLSEEICYQVKQCSLVFHETSLCVNCNGTKSCRDVTPIEPPSTCETSGECVVQVACNIATMCHQCESDPEFDTVITTVKEQTCECN